MTAHLLTIPVAVRFARRGASIKIGAICMNDLNKPLNDEEWQELSISCWAVIAIASMIGIAVFVLGGVVMAVLR